MDASSRELAFWYGDEANRLQVAARLDTAIPTPSPVPPLVNNVLMSLAASSSKGMNTSIPGNFFAGSDLNPNWNGRIAQVSNAAGPSQSLWNMGNNEEQANYLGLDQLLSNPLPQASPSMLLQFPASPPPPSANQAKKRKVSSADGASGPFLCPLCEPTSYNKLDTQSKVSRHFEFHQKRNEPVNLHCQVCNKRFHAGQNPDHQIKKCLTVWNASKSSPLTSPASSTSSDSFSNSSLHFQPNSSLTLQSVDAAPNRVLFDLNNAALAPVFDVVKMDKEFQIQAQLFYEMIGLIDNTCVVDQDIIRIISQNQAFRLPPPKHMTTLQQVEEILPFMVDLYCKMAQVHHHNTKPPICGYLADLYNLYLKKLPYLTKKIFRDVQTHNGNVTRQRLDIPVCANCGQNSHLLVPKTEYKFCSVCLTAGIHVFQARGCGHFDIIQFDLMPNDVWACWQCKRENHIYFKEDWSHLFTVREGLVDYSPVPPSPDRPVALEVIE
ncbi:hypothetical protein HDU97_010016 [Phlyctochytrium planicorne]|nr:hypothetical protein HDU97_010016 [Phlyctochytrium planicorne]